MWYTRSSCSRGIRWQTSFIGARRDQDEEIKNTNMVSEIGDRENAIEDEISLRIHKHGENETGAITKHQFIREKNGLEVFCLARSGSNSNTSAVELRADSNKDVD